MSATKIAAVLALAAMVFFALMMVVHSNETVTGALFYGAAVCLFLAGFIIVAAVAAASIRQLRYRR